MSKRPVVLSAILGLAGIAAAQGRAFDAVSVKKNTSGEFRAAIQVSPGGRFTATNVPARGLIRYAYNLQEFELGDLPNWTISERYDVVATSGGDPLVDHVREMVRALLADRFRLKAHVQKQEQPMYALTTASSDGRRGPRLRPSRADCGNVTTPSTPPADPLAERPCGFMGPAPGVDFTKERSFMTFRGLTMADLAWLLVAPLRRGVVDRTGLSGYFDGEFEFSAEFGPPPPPPGAVDPLDRPSLPSIFSTLPESLGLRLEPERGPVDVLVVDAIDRPAAD